MRAVPDAAPAHQLRAPVANAPTASARKLRDGPRMLRADRGRQRIETLIERRRVHGTSIRSGRPADSEHVFDSTGAV